MGIEWEYLGKESLPPGTFTRQVLIVFGRKVPGGWLVLTIMPTTQGSHSTTFYPDPQHEWDGGTL